MDATQNYLIAESNKSLGASLDSLEKLIADLKGVNVQAIAEFAPESLPAVHSTLQKVNSGLINLSMIAMVLNAISMTQTDETASL